MQLNTTAFQRLLHAFCICAITKMLVRYVLVVLY